MDVHLIGVPFDSAGRSAGVAQGPSALRAAGLVEALQKAGVNILDRDDLPLVTGSPERDRMSGIIAPDALITMVRSVRVVVRESLSDGAFPIVLGGDCPVLIGCLAAFDEPPGLLFVDGHEDAWPPHASTTGEAADMELGLLLGRSLESIPLELRAALPRVAPENVVVVGARDQAELAAAGIESIDTVVDVVRTEGVPATEIERLARDRIHRLDGGGPWWLHVDLDVLSSDSLAAVGYRQPGGLDWTTLTGLTRYFLGATFVVGWTITIYEPDLDPDRTGAMDIVRYVAASLASRSH
jgi:arginase